MDRDVGAMERRDLDSGAKEMLAALRVGHAPAPQVEPEETTPQPEEPPDARAEAYTRVEEAMRRVEEGMAQLGPHVGWEERRRVYDASGLSEVLEEARDSSDEGVPDWARPGKLAALGIERARAAATSSLFGTEERDQVTRDYYEREVRREVHGEAEVARAREVAADCVDPEIRRAVEHKIAQNERTIRGWLGLAPFITSAGREIVERLERENAVGREALRQVSEMKDPIRGAQDRQRSGTEARDGSRRSGPSPQSLGQEQRDRGSPRERLEGAVELLERETGRILDSEGYRSYLRAVGRFHEYSARNVALIHAQRPDATRVAGYKTWQALGRQVRRGEKGMTILVPLTRSRPVVDPENGEERVITGVRGFGTGTVFDIGQTEGRDLPEPPGARELGGEGEAGRELYGRLREWLQERGVQVRVEGTPGAWGSYDTRARRIAIDPRIADRDHGAKTLAHEAAHHVAGHLPGMDSRDIEPVAEGAAYAVCSRYGLDTGEYSFGYVARWAGEREVLTRNLEAIRSTAHELIEGLERSEKEDGV